MKKLALSLLVLTTGLTMVFSQKTINDANAEKRTVTSFHGIDVSTGIKLILIEGTTEEVAVSASTTEFRDHIITEVVNGILKIHYESKTKAINKKNETKGLKAYVSYKALDKLSVTTGAEVKIEGVLKSSSLELNSNTGGQVTGEIDITSLTVDQNTGSKITLTGKSGSLDIEGDTGSKFMGEGLTTTNCNATVSTGAGVYITVDKDLSVHANTGGYIKYKGEGGIRNIKMNTGGSVSKI